MKLFPGSAALQLEFNKVKDLLVNYCQSEYAREKARELRIHTKIDFVETELRQSHEYRQLNHAGRSESNTYYQRSKRRWQNRDTKNYWFTPDDDTKRFAGA